jgi:hypothetical protein
MAPLNRYGFQDHFEFSLRPVLQLLDLIRPRLQGKFRRSQILESLVMSISKNSDVQVGVLSRPQAGMADFYREMGELFGVELHPHNRHCVFHAMSVRDFTACRSNISRDAGPGFHGMSVQDFTSSWPGFHGEPSR